jgi:hypothetical protein
MHPTLGWCLSGFCFSGKICKQTWCRKMRTSAIYPWPHAVRWAPVSIFRMRRTVAEVETFRNVSGTDCYLVNVTRNREVLTTQSVMQVDVPPPFLWMTYDVQPRSFWTGAIQELLACLSYRSVLSPSKQSPFGVYVPGPVPPPFRDSDPALPVTPIEPLRCPWIVLHLTRFPFLATVRT